MSTWPDHLPLSQDRAIVRLMRNQLPLTTIAAIVGMTPEDVVTRFATLWVEETMRYAYAYMQDAIIDRLCTALERMAG